MKIGFITTHLGTFGSIRELVENANELILLGHEVTIYNKTHLECEWLPCKAQIKGIDEIDKLDALIMMDSPFPEIFEAWNNADAKFKTFVMMGFDPDNFVFADIKLTEIEKNLKHILGNYVICADGQWQIDYFKEQGLKAGISIGGINLRMFKDLGLKRTLPIGYSGDLRQRKGSSTIKQVIASFDHTDSYFKKGDQIYLVDFLNKTEIFIDNHLRAGWCNPVLEAMACGCAVICNDLPASKDFAIHNKTAVVLKDNSAENFVKNVYMLMNNESHRQNLINEAKEHIKQFDYKIVSRNFANFLEFHINA